MFLFTIMGVAIFNSCSGSAEETTKLQARGGYYDDIVGTADQEVYTITMDLREIRAEWEENLLAQGYDVDLTRFSIAKKVNTINPREPGDFAYLLIASNASSEISTGVFLHRNGGMFTIEPVADPTFLITITCTGCSYGCNLDWFWEKGKKVRYCKTNGCGSNCTKTESGTF